MKRKPILIVSSVTFLIVLIVLFFYWVTRCTQSDLLVEPSTDDVHVLMPFTDGLPYCIEPVPGILLKFDTGADISTLTEDYAQKLRDLGYDVKESFGPIAGRDGYGAIHFSWTRYTVDLPIGGYYEQTDSAGNVSIRYSGKPSSILRNVQFAKIDKGLSTVGLDVLSKFKLECRFDSRSVVFTKTIPSGYRRVVDMSKNAHLTDYLWSPYRSYIVISVNQISNLYFMDTGLQRAAIKKPVKAIAYSKQNLRTEIIPMTLGRSYKSYVDDSAWVDFGSRSGTKKIYYYSNNEDDYQVNPLNVFSQNIVIDIDGGAIYFRNPAAKPVNDPPFNTTVIPQ